MEEEKWPPEEVEAEESLLITRMFEKARRKSSCIMKIAPSLHYQREAGDLFGQKPAGRRCADAALAILQRFAYCTRSRSNRWNISSFSSFAFFSLGRESLETADPAFNLSFIINESEYIFCVLHSTLHFLARRKFPAAEREKSLPSIVELFTIVAIISMHFET